MTNRLAQKKTSQSFFGPIQTPQRGRTNHTTKVRFWPQNDILWRWRRGHVLCVNEMKIPPLTHSLDAAPHWTSLILMCAPSPPTSTYSESFFPADRPLGQMGFFFRVCLPWQNTIVQRVCLSFGTSSALHDGINIYQSSIGNSVGNVLSSISLEAVGAVEEMWKNCVKKIEINMFWIFLLISLSKYFRKIFLIGPLLSVKFTHGIWPIFGKLIL